MNDFKSLLKSVGYTKARLARELGIDPTTPTKWGEEPPQYALSYLKIVWEMQSLRERIRDSLKQVENLL